MRIAILGSGMVGQALAGKLVANGHDVRIGTRDPEATLKRVASQVDPDRTVGEWHAEHPDVQLVPYAEAAEGAEFVFVAVVAEEAINVIEQAGVKSLEQAIVIDVTNPFDYSQGFPPSLTVSNTDSSGEQIQRAYPNLRVVKSLNTVNAAVMVAPDDVGDGDHTVFVSGDDQPAKDEVASLVKSELGWTDVIDLGDITTARGTEMYMALWTRLVGRFGTPLVSIKVVGGER